MYKYVYNAYLVPAIWLFEALSLQSQYVKSSNEPNSGCLFM